jgi:hypothetical protein
MLQFGLDTRVSGGMRIGSFWYDTVGKAKNPPKTPFWDQVKIGKEEGLSAGERGPMLIRSLEGEP